MNLFKEFKLFILPAFKGLPLIVTMMVLGYLGASYALKYITPEYEVGAKIKLDNREHGVKEYELFEEKKSSSKGSNFLTEVEVFKTKSLQEKAFERLDAGGFTTEYFKIINGKNLRAANAKTKFVVACLATWAGDVRLIDNMILKRE